MSVAYHLGAEPLWPCAPKVETIPTGAERNIAMDHEIINNIGHVAGKGLHTRLTPLHTMGSIFAHFFGRIGAGIFGYTATSRRGIAKDDGRRRGSRAEQ